jgi:kynurenine formamidase
VAFRLDLPLGEPDPPLFGRRAMRHAVERYAGLDTAWDDRIDDLNTQQGSHWDGLRHLLRADGTGYGGRAPEDLGIDLWAGGICGRAVLVDLADGLDLAWDASRPVTGEEVEACARRQGVGLAAGDILLLRTGWLAGYLGRPPERRPARIASPGLASDEATTAWLQERRFAAVAADNPGLEALPEPPAGRMLHDRVIPDLGLAVGELWWLEELRADCVADGVWEGLLVSLPLRLPGGCASPANAAVLK